MRRKQDKDKTVKTVCRGNNSHDKVQHNIFLCIRVWLFQTVIFTSPVVGIKGHT